MSEFPEKLRKMAALQDKHNKEVHPQWRDQGHEYYRAVWIECGELLDHFGWKWWKYQANDIQQVRLEIIDIWHFGLSDLMRSEMLGDIHIGLSLAERMIMRSNPTGTRDFLEAVETLASKSLHDLKFQVDAFVDVLNALPMTLDELYELYIGKNVLNSFRQAHGYKDGTYIKTWEGREDNEHLAEIAENLDSDDAAFVEDLYVSLEERYAAAKREKS